MYFVALALGLLLSEVMASKQAGDDGPDLYDAASETAQRLGVALSPLRVLESNPREHTHGGYTELTVQDVIQQCRDALSAGMQTAEQEQAKARAAAKKAGLR